MLNTVLKQILMMLSGAQEHKENTALIHLLFMAVSGLLSKVK